MARLPERDAGRIGDADPVGMLRVALKKSIAADPAHPIAVTIVTTGVQRVGEIDMLDVSFQVPGRAEALATEIATSLKASPQVFVRLVGIGEFGSLLPNPEPVFSEAIVQFWTSVCAALEAKRCQLYPFPVRRAA